MLPPVSVAIARVPSASRDASASDVVASRSSTARAGVGAAARQAGLAGESFRASDIDEMHGHVCVPCGLHECAEAGKGGVRE